MSIIEEARSALADLERLISNCSDVEIKNFERLKTNPSNHTVAMLKAIHAVVDFFCQKKICIISIKVISNGKINKQ